MLYIGSQSTFFFHGAVGVPEGSIGGLEPFDELHVAVGVAHGMGIFNPRS